MVSYFSKGRGTSADVSEIELLLCCQDQWGQLL